MGVLRRINRVVTLVESGVAIAVLLLMLLTALLQVVIRNLALLRVDWAGQILLDMDWSDSLMRKSALWLAFVGASIATSMRKHIGMSVLTQLVSVRANFIVRALSSTVSGVIVYGMAVSFYAAVAVTLTERPLEYSILTPSGVVHSCDASDQALAGVEDGSRPVAFCMLRAALALIGLPAETPGATFMLILPLMLAVMGTRMLAHGIGAMTIVARGPEAVERAAAAERAAAEHTRFGATAPDQRAE